MRLRSRLFAALAFVLAAAGAPALADGFIVLPPPPPEQPHLRNVPLSVREHRVTVKVNDRIAVTEVDQVFVNPNPRQLEGTYLFPLPKGAAIDRFSMWVDGKELGAELLDATKARDIYEGIVRSMRDPALLEYAERGLFKARIFPIEANGEKRVRIRYAEVLPSESGTFAYRYPLATEKYSSRPLERASIDVSIEGSGPVASVWSPSHKIDVGSVHAGPGGAARASWEAHGTLPDRDFLLFWRPTAKPVAIAAMAYRDAPLDPEGTFLLVVAPRPAQAETPMPKDVVFVVDTSGSMAGAKIEQARNALRFCIRSLGDGDRFGIVPFSTEPRPFRAELAAATPENRAAAEGFVDTLIAQGGTAIDDALKTGLTMLPADGASSGRPAYVLFMTDGLPTIGESDPDAIVRHTTANARGARVFAFGVGNDVNTRLLDRLADELRGAGGYVAESENIEEKVSNLYGKMTRPAFTDVELRIDGVAVSAVHPARLPDLFYGAETLVAGRYTAGGSAVIRLRGKVRGQPVEIVEELKLPDASSQHGFLPRLWAVRRVGFLLDEIRLRGETVEVKDEVVRLAKKYGIVTPYTSYLIVEDERRTLASGPRRRSGGGGSGGGRTAGSPPEEDTDLFASGGGGDSGGGGPPADAAKAPAPAAAARKMLEESAQTGGEAKGRDSGAAAVDDARTRGELRDYEGVKDDGFVQRQQKEESLLLHHEGRSFVRRGDAWWEFGTEKRAAPRRIRAYSDDYFALLRAKPELGKWMSLGRVVLLSGDVSVEIVD